MSEEGVSKFLPNPHTGSVSQPTITTQEPSTIYQYNVVHTPNSEEIANQVVATIQPMLTRLTTEVQSLLKELQQLKTEKVEEKSDIMPAQPFKEMQAFFDFEKRLQENGQDFASFENELAVIAKAPNFIENCWRKIISDELGEQLFCKDTESKRSVRNLSTTKAIRNAAISVGSTEDQVIKGTRSFFQFVKKKLQTQ